MCLNCVPHTPLLNCVCVRFFPLFRPYFLFFPKPVRLILNALLLTKQARRKKTERHAYLPAIKTHWQSCLCSFVCFLLPDITSALRVLSLSVTLLTKRFNAKKKKIEVRYMFYLQVQSVNYASPLSLPLSCISFFFFPSFYRRVHAFVADLPSARRKKICE